MFKSSGCLIKRDGWRHILLLLQCRDQTRLLSDVSVQRLYCLISGYCIHSDFILSGCPQEPRDLSLTEAIALHFYQSTQALNGKNKSDKISLKRQTPQEMGKYSVIYRHLVQYSCLLECIFFKEENKKEKRFK